MIVVKLRGHFLHSCFFELYKLSLCENSTFNLLLTYFFFSFQFQALFTMDPSEHGRRLFGMGPTVNGTENVEKPHTLEDYAIDHFRPPPKRTASKSLTLASARRGNFRNSLLRNKSFMLFSAKRFKIELT